MTELVPPSGYQNYHILIVPSLPASLLATYTPGYAELILDEDTKELVVGDGATLGGAYRVGSGGAGGGTSWYTLHIDGASSTTDLTPTAGSTQLTLGGLYGFSFLTDTVSKKLIGAMPVPGPVGEGLQSTGSAWISAPIGGTWGGRALPTFPQVGDYTTLLVTQVEGYNYLNKPVTTAPTDGQALVYSSAANGYVGGSAGSGGSSAPSQIDLLANPTFDPTNPPSYAFYSNVRVLSFGATTSQTIYGSCIWPGGSSFTVKIHVSMLSTTSGTIGFGFTMMKTTPGAAVSNKTDSYGAENLGSATVNSTAQGIVQVSIALSNIDGAVAGDAVRWKLRRNTSVGGNASGNAEVWAAGLFPSA